MRKRTTKIKPAVDRQLAYDAMIRFLAYQTLQTCGAFLSEHHATLIENVGMDQKQPPTVQLLAETLLLDAAGLVSNERLRYLEP